jgi:hypothetical protein
MYLYNHLLTIPLRFIAVRASHDHSYLVHMKPNYVCGPILSIRMSREDQFTENNLHATVRLVVDLFTNANRTAVIPSRNIRSRAGSFEKTALTEDEGMVRNEFIEDWMIFWD